MTISTSDLTSERQVLEKDFEALSSRIKQVDQELIQMKIKTVNFIKLIMYYHLEMMDNLNWVLEKAIVIKLQII